MSKMGEYALEQEELQDDAWWSQLDQDEHYQQQHDNVGRSERVRKDALEQCDNNVNCAFGRVSMMVIELRDLVNQLREEK